MRKARDWEGYSRFPVFPIEKFRFFARIQKIESATIYMILWILASWEHKIYHFWRAILKRKTDYNRSHSAALNIICDHFSFVRISLLFGHLYADLIWKRWESKGILRKSKNCLLGGTKTGGGRNQSKTQLSFCIIKKSANLHTDINRKVPKFLFHFTTD